MIISLFYHISNNIEPANWTLWVQNLQKHLNLIANQHKIHRFREYHFELGFKLHKVYLPIVDDGEGSYLLWPAGLVRCRKYPLAVYLFAVSIYLNSDLSMRKVAVLTRKQFGLQNFSHSTISRTLGSLAQLVNDFGQEPTEIQDAPPKKTCKLHSTLQLRLASFLKDIPKNPFLYAQKLAFQFFHLHQILML